MTRDNDSPLDLHSIPCSDIRPHTNSRSCWCEPYNEDESEPFVWTHRFIDFEKSGSRIH